MRNEINRKRNHEKRNKKKRNKTNLQRNDAKLNKSLTFFVINDNFSLFLCLHYYFNLSLPSVRLKNWAPGAYYRKQKIRISRALLGTLRAMKIFSLVYTGSRQGCRSRPFLKFLAPAPAPDKFRLRLLPLPLPLVIVIVIVIFTVL